MAHRKTMRNKNKTEGGKRRRTHRRKTHKRRHSRK